MDDETPVHPDAFPIVEICELQTALVITGFLLGLSKGVNAQSMQLLGERPERWRLQPRSCPQMFGCCGCRLWPNLCLASWYALDLSLDLWVTKRFPLNKLVLVEGHYEVQYWKLHYQFF